MNQDNHDNLDDKPLPRLCSPWLLLFILPVLAAVVAVQLVGMAAVAYVMLVKLWYIGWPLLIAFWLFDRSFKCPPPPPPPPY